MSNLIVNLLNQLINEDFSAPGEDRKIPVQLWSLAKSQLKKPFVRSVSIVAGGTVISQAINMLFSPIITRLYDPGMFGVLGVFLSVVSVLTPVAKLCLPYAIVLPAKEEDSLLLTRFSLLFGSLFSFFTLVIILVFGQQIAHALRLDQYTRYLYFIPVALFLSVTYSAYDHWLIRHKKFNVSSIISVTQSLMFNLTLVGIGYFFPPYASLIGINIFGKIYHAFASMITTRKSIKRAREQATESVSLFSKKGLRLLHEYRDFPIYRTPQILLNNLSANLPVLMLTLFFGPASAGLYELGRRVLKLPAVIVADSVAKVFNQRVAETSHTNRPIQPMLIRTTAVLMVVAIVPFGIIFFFGPVLFSWVFGADWATAGVYARWMALWLFFTFINRPSIKSIPVLMLQKQYLFYEVITSIIRLASIAIGYLITKNDVITIAIYSIVGSLINIVVITYVTVVSRYRRRELGPEVGLDEPKGP